MFSYKNCKLYKKENWKYIKENFLVSLQIGILFTTVHEIILIVFKGYSFSFNHFMNFETTIRLLFSFIVAWIFISILSTKNKELSESEKYFRTIIQSAHDAIITINNKGLIVGWNTSAEKIFGYSEKEAINKNFNFIIPERHRQSKFNDFNQLEIEERSDILGKTIKVTGLHKNGFEIPFELSVSGLKTHTGKFFTGILRDITERKKFEKEKEETFNILNETGRMAKVGGWKLDLRTKKQSWTYEVYRLVEIELQGINNLLPQGFNFYTESSKPIIREALQKTIQYGEPYELELEIITAKGNRIWIHTTGKANRKDNKNDGEIISISGTIQDITYRKKLEEELKRISNTDGLTGLLNRRHFDEQLQIEIDRVIRYKQSLVMLFLDVDNFKIFNDTYGHTDGDQVLIRLALVLKKCLRTTDFTHRYGGEEFTVMLPGMRLEEGVIVAEKIQETFNHEVFITTSGKQVMLSLSIGVAHYFGKETIDEFIARADKRMYEAKTSGKNKVCY